MHKHPGIPELKLPYLLRWGMIILLIKSLLFVYFCVQFNHYTPAEHLHSLIAVEMADSETYYIPAEDFASEWQYTTMCRMPGLLPIYVPFSWIGGPDFACAMVIIIQFLLSVLSVLLLAITAQRIFPKRYVFEVTAIVYALSSFVSIWDHALMSDSLSVTFLIFSVYSLTGFIKRGSWIPLMMAGVWLTWSMFIRQIAIVEIPVLMLMILLYTRNTIWSFVVRCSIMMLPFVVATGAWTFRNYQLDHQFVPLVKPVEECYATYTRQFMKINKLLIAWGEDIQYWQVDEPAHWFNSMSEQQQPFFTENEISTSVCNNDSLLKLQHAYVAFRNSPDPLVVQQSGDYVLNRAELYANAFKSERAFDYYIKGRWKLFSAFVFPKRLDNLPGPAFAQMNILQKAIKFGNYLLLILVNLVAVVYSFWMLYKRRWKQLAFAAVPWSIVALLGVFFGFIEQRYFVPVFPFFVVLFVAALLEIYAWWMKRKEGGLKSVSADQ